MKKNINSRMSGIFCKKKSPDKLLAKAEKDLGKIEVHSRASESERMKKFVREKEKKKNKRVHISKHQQIRNLKSYIEKAGLSIKPEKLERYLFFVTILLSVLYTIYYYIRFSQDLSSIYTIIFILLILWTFGFVLILLVVRAILYMYLDNLMYKRQLEVEKVLPDFLQLVASNIRAGMPIDRALWYAVRPRFGVLAKEIESVAKETLSGEELDDSLMRFANKFQSVQLKRSMSLLIEGMDAGGEIGELLNKISIDMQETSIMKKEMAANVMTYAIFITFASIVAAPFLFALSLQLITVVQSIAGAVATESMPSGSGMMSFSISKDSVVLADFSLFCYLTLSIIAFFSGVIVSIIQKGNIREGIRNIPLYIIVAVAIFYFASKGLGIFLGGII